MALVKEFKEFVMKGNVVDMAVGIIIGLAFGKIVTSVVNDIIMPPIGYLLGGIDFSNLMFVMREATPTTAAVAIRYGVFINTVIDFLLVAAAVFLLVKAINRLRAQPVPAPTVRKCPECQMDIPITAKRCGHCTSPV